MRSFVLALAAICAAVPAAAQTEPARPVVLPNETILRVQGEGYAATAPDRMWVTIGVETTGATAEEALDANNRKLAPVVELLRARGIEPADMQTTGLDVDAQYDEGRERSRERITGFRATNTINVLSRDLETAGELISRLFEAGANTINGPTFGVSDEEVVRLTRLAEADALRSARAQADQVAETLGMRVSRVLLVWDRDVDVRNGSGYIMVTGSRIMDTPIEPGETIVAAEYSVEFALIPQ